MNGIIIGILCLGRESVTLMDILFTSFKNISFARPQLFRPRGSPKQLFDSLPRLQNTTKPKLTFEFWYFVPREGVEHYMFSTPIGWIDALRFQSNSIGLRLPHVSDIESLTPRHMIKAPDGALFSHVPREGVEPSRLATHDFESCAYTNSATEAFNFYQSRII